MKYHPLIIISVLIFIHLVLPIGCNTETLVEDANSQLDSTLSYEQFRRLAAVTDSAPGERDVPTDDNIYVIDWSRTNADNVSLDCRLRRCKIGLNATKNGRSYTLKLDPKGTTAGFPPVNDFNNLYHTHVQKLQKVMFMIRRVYDEVSKYNNAVASNKSIDTFVEVHRFRGPLAPPYWPHKYHIRFFFNLEMDDALRYLGVTHHLMAYEGNTYNGDTLTPWTWRDDDESFPIGSKKIYAVDIHMDQRTPFNNKYDDDQATLGEGLFKCWSLLKKWVQVHNVADFHTISTSVMIKDEPWSGRRSSTKYNLQPSWMFHTHAPVCGNLYRCRRSTSGNEVESDMDEENDELVD